MKRSYLYNETSHTDQMESSYLHYSINTRNTLITAVSGHKISLKVLQKSFFQQLF